VVDFCFFTLLHKIFAIVSFYTKINVDDNLQLKFVMPNTNIFCSNQKDNCRGMLVFALLMINLVTLPWVMKEQHWKVCTWKICSWLESNVNSKALLKMKIEELVFVQQSWGIYSLKVYNFWCVWKLDLPMFVNKKLPKFRNNVCKFFKKNYP